MDKFELLCLLEAISNYAYDIHYTANGRFFFSDHLFSERLSDVDVKDDFIETFYLGKSQEAPASADIARKVADLTPETTDNTQDNFKRLRNMIIRALMGIQAYDGTKGEEDLLGSVAHILQRHNGLLYRQLTYTPEEIRNDNSDWRDIVSEEDTTQTLENEKWITVHPNKENPDDYRRLKVEDGETSQEAVERKFGKDKAEKKEPEKETEGKKDQSEEKKSGQKVHPKIKEYMKFKKERDAALRKMGEYEDEFKKKYNEKLENNKEYQNLRELTLHPSKGDFTEIRNAYHQMEAIRKQALEDARNETPEYLDAYKKYNDLNKWTDEKDKYFDAIKDIQSGLKDRLAEISKDNDEIYNKIIGFGDELTVLQKERDEARKKRDDYFSQLWKKDMPADEIRAGIDEYHEKAVEAGKRIKELQDKIAHDVGNLLREKKGVYVKFEKSTIKGVEEELNEVFGGVLPDGMQPDVLPTVSTIRGRAHCSGRNLALRRDGDVQTIIHEYMHFVEDHNPQMLANSIAFLRYRTDGEKLKSLKSLTGISYGAKEKARPDKFFNPYCGKSYALVDDNYLDATATEVMSMGVEQLYKDPVGFAKSDREYFDFVIANLKGRL